MLGTEVLGFFLCLAAKVLEQLRTSGLLMTGTVRVFPGAHSILLVLSCGSSNSLHIYMFWVLKRTFQLRRLFQVPTSYV